MGLQNEEWDEDADMQAGFMSAQGAEEPKEKAEAAPKEESPPEQASTDTPAAADEKKDDKPEQPEPDPFASLPPQVRDLLARVPTLEQQYLAVEQRARTAEGRVASLQSRLDKLSQPQHEEPQPQKKLSARDAIRTDLPEIAAALDELAAELPQRQQAVEQPTQQPAQRQQADPQEEVLDQIRPSWGQELGSTDFQLWLARQPVQYRHQVATTTKAADILGALAAFDKFTRSHTQTNGINEARQARMSAAVIPQGDGRRPSNRAPAEYDEEAEMAEGFRRAQGR